MDLLALLLRYGANARVHQAAHGYKGGALIAPGTTALHAAVRRGDTDMVQLLLDHGAPIDAVDGNGQTPRDLARYFDHTRLVELLESNRSHTEPQ